MAFWHMTQGDEIKEQGLTEYPVREALNKTE